ncbi:SDR family oxidoreductase [Pedobacter alluvionis]|uniref:Nucleoside-diphosphate-sugar epimerase n=1 Tax=Pedobacter alluvionis TaxID=475253 RepID=A0A497XWB7_9SPHI|nr:SDR family oxidoreductase [Pedobacter alluvionis]RLJ73836.1 nucleoside-diphosphate-sugar epimerase [Pedobacter alluvionis]TFB32551.1 SDR family oxidoreductase [Pedobacter alluvionis]
MKVFVTGATGFVGSAVVKELINAGHEVLGLARNETAEKALVLAGAEVHKGDLEDLASLQEGARLADGIIHTGFIHDFSRFAAVCEIDRVAIETIGNSIAGTDKPFIVTSGTLIVNPGMLATEDMLPNYNGANPRLASEKAVDALASQNIRVSVVRLSPSVHGEGDHHGFVPMMIDIARKTGSSGYIGGGENQWTGVHRLDAAKLYRLALEQATPGARFHGVAEESITLKTIAESIGEQLGLPVVSISKNEAAAHFGWFEHFVSIDGPASGRLTRERLNWEPEYASLLQDLEHGIYFK